MKKVFVFLLAVLMVVMAGCGGQKNKVAEMNMQEVYDSFVPSLPGMLIMDESMMLNFCGIEAAMCKQAVVAVCSDGLRADEIWLIEATDAKTLEELEALAQSRLTRKGEESITYSPEQYEVVQAAQVLTAGNYLAVIVTPEAAALAELFQAASKG